MSTDRMVNPSFAVFPSLLLLLARATSVSSFQYTVGHLNCWGVPPSGNPKLYTYWPDNIDFKLYDSLLFLYPPSRDSVVQVSKISFDTCNITDPILYINDGNSLFNFTTRGDFFFTSGVPGSCDKLQKLQVSVLAGNSTGISSAPSPSYLPAFGSIPQPLPSTSASQGLWRIHVMFALGFVILQAVALC